MAKSNKKIIKKQIFVRAAGLVCNSSSNVTKPFVGKKVSIYNGRLYQTFTVKPAMVGYKFGFFIVTKALGSKIHMAIKNRKLKKLVKKK